MDTSVKSVQLINKKDYISSNADTLLLSAGLLAASVFTNGYSALYMAAVCLLSGTISEYICFTLILKKKSFGNLSAFASSILVAMLLPAQAPLYIGALAAFFAVCIAKVPFGDGRNAPFVPAAAGFCFVAMLFPAEVFNYASEAVKEAPLLDMLINGNGVRLNLFGISRLVTGSYPGAIGTAVPGALAGVFLYRLVRNPKSLLPTLGFIASSAGFICLFPRLNTDLLTCVVCELCAGSLLFTALMLINDPVTSPAKPLRAIAYGFIGGIVSILLRYYGNVYDGSVFAVLIMNCLWPAFFGETVSGKLFRKKRIKKSKNKAVTESVSDEKEGGDVQ